MGKVTIIIPIYNAYETIDKCLDSVIKQTYKDIEVIIINDGSKDNSINKINMLNNIDILKLLIKRMKE